MTLHVLSITGQEIVSSRLNVNTGMNYIPLSLDHLSPGVYTVAIRNATGLRYVNKVVIGK